MNNRMKNTKISTLAATAFSVLAAMPSITMAQGAGNFPDKTVKFVVPLTPGSGADIVGRIVAKYLSDLWKQPVIIDNKPGAAGLIGTGAVVSSPADGYTLLVQSASYAANPAIYKKLPYDPLKSLIDVNILGITPYVMVASPTGPYANLKDLVAAAKAKPNEIPFASAGVGSSTHLAAEYFNQTMGIQLIHVPYKGSPEAMQDTIAGRTAFYMAPLDAAIGQIKGGRVKGVGVTTSARSEAANDIPTIAEQGYANYDLSLWFGLWAPAGTPPAIVQKINADINKAMQDPEVRNAFAKGGVRAKPMSPDEFSVFVRDEMSKFQKIAKDAKIEPQ
jgi:tripartite-type tricarboxylate transporter receptor subunit TctC